jgi:hypothetical protein
MALKGSTLRRLLENSLRIGVFVVFTYLHPIPAQAQPKSLQEQLTEQEPYGEGVYGKIGFMPVFFASRAKVPDYDRLYWVMVRVLSEKFGCYMTNRNDVGETTQYRCRDGRYVTMTRSSGPEYVLFYCHQYDRHGRELFVQNKTVVARGKIKKRNSGNVIAEALAH